MQISGVGSGYSYHYDMRTGRLSSANGAPDDEFVRYYNGETDGTDSSTLNGYDQRTKGAIRNAIDRIQDFYKAGLMDKPLAEDGASEFTISYEIEDSVTTSVSINGEKRLTMVAPMFYLPEEILSFSAIASEFQTREHRDYDPSDNSIHIAVGDRFSYGNGYQYTVGANKVMGSGYDGKSEAENRAADRFMLALDSLLHFADQQYSSAMIEKEWTPQLLKFLREQGVDTSREFIVNETRCEVRDGRICEAGNKTGIPNTIYNKALARYEEELEMPLAGRGEEMIK